MGPEDPNHWKVGLYAGEAPADPFGPPVEEEPLFEPPPEAPVEPEVWPPPAWSDPEAEYADALPFADSEPPSSDLATEPTPDAPYPATEDGGAPLYDEPEPLPTDADPMAEGYADPGAVSDTSEADRLIAKHAADIRAGNAGDQVEFRVAGMSDEELAREQAEADIAAQNYKAEELARIHDQRLAEMEARAEERAQEDLEYKQRMDDLVMRMQQNAQRQVEAPKADIGAIVGLLLGGMASAHTGQNPAMAIWENRAKREMEAQRANIENERLGLQMERGTLGDYRKDTLAGRTAEDLFMAEQYTVLAQAIEQKAAALDPNGTMFRKAEMEARKARYAAEERVAVARERERNWLHRTRELEERRRHNRASIGAQYAGIRSRERQAAQDRAWREAEAEKNRQHDLARVEAQQRLAASRAGADDAARRAPTPQNEWSVVLPFGKSNKILGVYKGNDANGYRDFQNRLLDKGKLIQQLNDLEADARRIGSRYGGPGAELLGDDDRKRLQARYERIMADYKKSVTGAAASDKEMERLERAFPPPEKWTNLSPLGAWRDFRSEELRAIENDSKAYLFPDSYDYGALQQSLNPPEQAAIEEGSRFEHLQSAMPKERAGGLPVLPAYKRAEYFQSAMLQSKGDPARAAHDSAAVAESQKAYIADLEAANAPKDQIKQERDLLRIYESNARRWGGIAGKLYGAKTPKTTTVAEDAVDSLLRGIGKR